jgi:hypothetical protein
MDRKMRGSGAPVSGLIVDLGVASARPMRRRARRVLGRRNEVLITEAWQ